MVGGVLLAPALAGLLYGLSNVHAEGGFTRADVLVPGIGGAVLLAGFVLWAAHRAGDALVDVRVFAVRSVRVSSMALTFFGAAVFAGNFLLPLCFQSLRGDDALHAALLLIPQGVGALLARFVVAKLVERFGPRLVSVSGFLLMAVTTVPFALAGADTSLWVLGVVLFLRGVGNGVLFIPIITYAYMDIRRDQMPHTSAITRIVQQLGGAFGTALVAVVLTAAADPEDPAAAFHAAFWWTVGITAFAAVFALFMPGRDGQGPDARSAYAPARERVTR